MRLILGLASRVDIVGLYGNKINFLKLTLVVL